MRELHDLGFRAPHPARTQAKAPVSIGTIERDTAAALILTRLGARRSVWNTADIRGEAEKLIAAAGVIADVPVRRELAEDLTARAASPCRPLLNQPNVPEHIRSLSSPAVLAVEAELQDRLAVRADQPVVTPRVRSDGRLDEAQQRVVAAIDGTAQLLVIEGAAGAGKTTTLAAVRETLEAGDARRLVVVTPTLKAARVAGDQLGAAAFSAAWFVHQHGYRWDEDGAWTRVESASDRMARLFTGDVLLVDEAGMLDQDTARALLTIADEAKARVVLVGDRHQLPAVGRGGVLDLAARWVRPEAHLELEAVHRFADAEYAELSLLMRTGERSREVFDALLERGQVVVHASEVERAAAIARLGPEPLVIADTRAQVAQLNAVIRDCRGALVDQAGDPITDRGERIGLGDRVATRRNDRELGVANRDTWVVAGVGDDGSLLVAGRSGQRHLPPEYVREHVELAYATTVYGAQGSTVDEAHLIVGDSTGAASAYVGMTRGRHQNVAHLVAESVDDAKQQWVQVFSRDRADLGPGHAADLAAADVDRYGPMAPSPSAHLQGAGLGNGVRRPPEPTPSTESSSSPGIGR